VCKSSILRVADRRAREAIEPVSHVSQIELMVGFISRYRVLEGFLFEL
jgi:hypothetical protein